MEIAGKRIVEESGWRRRIAAQGGDKMLHLVAVGIEQNRVVPLGVGKTCVNRIARTIVGSADEDVSSIRSKRTDSDLLEFIG